MACMMYPLSFHCCTRPISQKTNNEHWTSFCILQYFTFCIKLGVQPWKENEYYGGLTGLFNVDCSWSSRAKDTVAIMSLGVCVCVCVCVCVWGVRCVCSRKRLQLGISWSLALNKQLGRYFPLGKCKMHSL